MYGPVWDVARFEPIKDIEVAGDLVFRWTQVQSDLRSLEKMLAEIEIAAKSSATKAIDVLAEFAVPETKNPEKRKKEAVEALLVLRHSLLKPNSPREKDRQYDACVALLRLYASIDTAALKNDLSEFLAVDKPASERRAQVQGKMGAQVKKQNAILSEANKALKPGSELNPQAAIDLLQEFIGTWAYRAKFYDVPVDIRGFAIASMKDLPVRDRLLKVYTQFSMGRDKALIAYKARLVPQE